jgi:hypothetical protein
VSEQIFQKNVERKATHRRRLTGRTSENDNDSRKIATPYKQQRLSIHLLRKQAGQEVSALIPCGDPRINLDHERSAY